MDDWNLAEIPEFNLQIGYAPIYIYSALNEPEKDQLISMLQEPGVKMSPCNPKRIHINVQAF